MKTIEKKRNDHIFNFGLPFFIALVIITFMNNKGSAQYYGSPMPITQDKVATVCMFMLPPHE